MQSLAWKQGVSTQLLAISASLEFRCQNPTDSTKRTHLPGPESASRCLLAHYGTFQETSGSFECRSMHSFINSKEFYAQYCSVLIRRHSLTNICFHYSDENDLFFEVDEPQKMKVRLGS